MILGEGQVCRGRCSEMSCLFSEVRSRQSPGLWSSSSVLSIWSSSPTSLSASSVWSSAGQFGSFCTGRFVLEKLASRSSSELLGWGLSLGFLRLRLAKMEERSSSLLYWSLPDPQEPCYRTKQIKKSVSLQYIVINPTSQGRGFCSLSYFIQGNFVMISRESTHLWFGRVTGGWI